MRMFLRVCGQKWKGFWKRIAEWFEEITDRVLIFLIGKVVKDMAMVYATLIIKGKKTFVQVPAGIKEQVREILIDLDCEHLIVE